MKTVIVWDLPIRMFHWLFAACCLGALGIGLTMDDDSPLFRAHMLLGLAAGFLLVVRVVIGIVGSTHNRLTALLFSPAETIRYFAGVVTGQAARRLVHNPGSALITIGMFLVIPLLIATGLANGSEGAEGPHEALAFGLLALVLLHLAGLVIHTFRHREFIALSMITGTKKAEGAEEGLRSNQFVFGVAILLAAVLWTGALLATYNGARGTVQLPMTGLILQLGENEGDRHESHRHEHHDDD